MNLELFLGVPKTPKIQPISTGETSDYWLKIMNGRRCYLCDNVFQTNDLTIDHVLPKIKGGSRACNNLMPACRHCNTLKGDKFTQEHVNLLSARDYLWNYFNELSRQGATQRSKSPQKARWRRLSRRENESAASYGQRRARRLLQLIRSHCRESNNGYDSIRTSQDQLPTSSFVSEKVGAVLSLSRALLCRVVGLLRPCQRAKNHTALKQQGHEKEKADARTTA